MTAEIEIVEVKLARVAPTYIEFAVRFADGVAGEVILGDDGLDDFSGITPEYADAGIKAAKDLMPSVGWLVSVARAIMSDMSDE